MTDLTKLRVSLTKHGAHKLATLLRIYNKDEVLKHLWGTARGSRIEEVQARVNLSARQRGKDVAVPALWNEVRSLGDPAIDAAVLLAIIFSHHQLMEALQTGAIGDTATGIVTRDEVISDKAFTNFAHVIEELGYSVEHKKEFISYDFTRMFAIKGLNVVAAELLKLKLTEARWSGKGSFVDELVTHGFHRALAVSADYFRNWLGKGAQTVPPVVIDEDGFFSGSDGVDAEVLPGAFVFVPGHKGRKTGTVPIAPRSAVGRATLLHNKMQDALVAELVAKHGKDFVGSEQSTGNGTAIDCVVKTGAFCWFYEIKTARSVRACIRQAIPQLLEYAYWHGGKDRCDRLIIVGPSALTKQAAKYLEFLNQSFGLEFHYERLKV